jgi:hypothetical protein
VGILLCFRRCGCKSPLAAAAATASGEQRHQQDGRKHELSDRSDGKGGPSGRTSTLAVVMGGAAPAVHEPSSRSPQRREQRLED